MNYMFCMLVTNTCEWTNYPMFDNDGEGHYDDNGQNNGNVVGCEHLLVLVCGNSGCCTATRLQRP